MKNNPVKPKITKQALFVVKKNGHQNGYGKTPKAAYLDFERRKKLKSKQALFMSEFASNVEHIKRLEIYLKEAKKDLHNRLNPPRDNTSWLIYSMLATGETDAKKAIEKMRSFGAKINDKDILAADVLSKNLAEFKKNLEAQVKGRTL